MEELNELPGKKTPEIEDPKRKKSSSDPEIETPPPPQIIDPSSPPDTERKNPAASPGKRKRIPLTQHVKLNI